MKIEPKTVLMVARKSGLLSPEQEDARLAELFKDARVEEALVGMLAPSLEQKLRDELQKDDVLQFALFEELLEGTTSMRTPEGAQRLAEARKQAIEKLKETFRANLPAEAAEELTTSAKGIEIR